MSGPTAAEVNYLLSLEAVRERANGVFDIAQLGGLKHFHYRPECIPEFAEAVAQTISRDLGPVRYHEVPPHGRWQHFNVGGVDRVSRLLQGFRGTADPKEQARTLIDLIFVSVLLDEGAGNEWQYQEPNLPSGTVYDRSEGIAVASLYMFESSGFFHSHPDRRFHRAPIPLLLTAELMVGGPEARTDEEDISVANLYALRGSDVFQLRQ
ncbi:hypothetical protein LTR10_024158 [Elasticomyces elasticus]|uniref:DUF1688 domain-containing protein n=1 Tax=Exophiala sideris TaxID=1016849 RepID=A0ABR0IU73_9EURO|nr:hypothetical protein LTR10_024158 [Elasticomyces elasticus]KAK5020823.1 hypothetical protein LTS07_011412 [Exophiala sideris]KAK5048141.1 hypothetical protein LTR69_011427 [Exophiala sideris]KAK5176033.1 hypothetical protein LTR44_011409 [Eurotiomycetes sp. CCFEE 6388]